MRILLENKNAIVYGGGGAIGGAVSRAFACEGAHLFLAGRTLAKVEAVAEEISAAGGTAEAARVDALDEQTVDEQSNAVAEEAGSIDVSFNAVSIRTPAGGKTSALAVARMYAALLGEVDGVRLISPERLREVSAVAMSGVDEVFGFPTSWGLGYSIGQFMSNAHETQHVFGVGGVGGSHAYVDTKTGTTFALTKNRLTPTFDTAEQVAGIVTKAVAES
jgi:NAD(P)-dependent dehydrogenase (short-subunit alcohol dehydrogenase family)